MFDEIALRPCRRPTKSGKPCRAQYSGRGFACKLHTTEHEAELVRAYEQGLTAGRAQERRTQEQSTKLHVAHLERQVQELREKLDGASRRFEVAGRQAVTVDGYGYLWAGEGALVVGDRVLLPENYVSALRHGPGPFVGTVTALGTTYDGRLNRIIGRAAQPSDT